MCPVGEFTVEHGQQECLMCEGFQARNYYEEFVSTVLCGEETHWWDWLNTETIVEEED